MLVNRGDESLLGTPDGVESPDLLGDFGIGDRPESVLKGESTFSMLSPLMNLSILLRQAS